MMQKQWNAYNLPACIASNHDLVISFTQGIFQAIQQGVHDHLWITLAKTKEPGNLITS